LTIAAGTLAVSVTFAHDIAPTPQTGSAVLLLVGWAALGLAVIAIVSSFLLSQVEIRRQLGALDAGRQHRLGKVAAVTFTANLLAGALLVAGLSLLAVYVFTNISH
jgi:hypothetical protein